MKIKMRSGGRSGSRAARRRGARRAPVVVVLVALCAAALACARPSLPPEPAAADRPVAGGAADTGEALAPGGPAVPDLMAPPPAPAATPAVDPPRAPAIPLPPVPLPEILFTDLAGLRGDLARLRARGRPVLVNFWATWCGPCVHELPLLGDLAREWGDGGPAVLGVSLDHLTAPDDDRAMGLVQRILITHRVSYPNRIIRGRQQEVLDAYGIAGGIPFSILYDGRGGVARRFSGGVGREAITEALRAIDQAVGS